MTLFKAAPGPAVRSDRLTWLVAAGAVAVAAALLLPSLGSYPGPALLVWEGPTADAFEEPMRTGVSALRFLAGRFLLEDGVFSEGGTALFFGPPAYSFLLASPSATALRLPSAIATLLAIAVAAWLAARHETRSTARVLPVLVALSPLVLYYGRYGSCIAGSLLAVWLALFACLEAVRQETPTVRHGLLAAAALCACALQYAPARLAALWLLGATVAALVLKARARPAAWKGLAALLALVGAFAVLQISTDHGRAFLRARGEQVFSLLDSPDFVSDVAGRRVEPGTLTLAEKTSVVLRLAGRKTGDLASLLAPRVPHPAGDEIVHGDPPRLPLLAAALAPFALWGAWISLRRVRELPQAMLLGLVAAIAVPLLLTNRVDAHRASILVVPLLVLTARGLAAAAESASRRGVPAVAIGLGGALVLTWVGLDLARSRNVSRTKRTLLSDLQTALASRPEPFALLVEGDHRDVTVARLALRARRPRPGQWPETSLPESVRLALRSSAVERRRNAIRDLERFATAQPVLLGPREFFREALAELGSAGFTVHDAAGREDDSLFWVSFRPPTTTNATAQDAKLRRVPLTSLEPIAVWGELVPPRFGMQWDGAPFALAGRETRTGIGLHAPASLTYAVPKGAIAFEAWTGFAPDAAECDRPATVVFEVRDGSGRLLQTTSLLTPKDGPRLVSVPVKGVEKLILRAGEGPDGRDCDHAAIGDAAFVFGDAP